MADTVQLLRAKALLLIRREREVNELRQERSRIEVWLKVFHKLALGLQGKDAQSLLDEWVAAMVGELAFQIAAVHACDPDGRLQLLAGVGPGPLPAEAPYDAAEFELLQADGSGFFSYGEPTALQPLAEAVGYGRCYFLLISVRGERLLLSAGFGGGNERFYSAIAQDFPHFSQLGNHLAALLENAALIAELDREKSELRESGKRLAEVSRRAGMADIATGVLHNVGNALNSVNVSAELMAARTRGSRATSVARLASMLNGAGDLSQFFARDPRAPKLPEYLQELGTHLSDERDVMLREVVALQEHVEHIKAIVSRQQAYATSFDMSQHCVVSALVDDAVALSEQSFSKHGIQLVREYQAVPEIMLDRHKALQILINLLKNAKDALLGIEQSEKRIVARIGAGPAGFVRIAICDNGVGIAAEELSKLFRYGFTTKRGGHGFGLHTSAIAAEELGARLNVQSEGRGRGATFVLDLPIRGSA